VVALLLSVVTIAGIWALVQRNDASRDAQLQTSSLTVSLDDLGIAPFSADPRAGSAQASRTKIHADEQSLVRGIAAGAQPGVPASLLAAGRGDLRKIEPLVHEIFEIAIHEGLASAGPLVPKLNGILIARSSTLSHVLAAIGSTDSARAYRAKVETMLGAAAAILLLLAAFAFFYLRSTAARAVVERLGNEARCAAEVNALARDEAVEASNEKSMFIASMSHELRTPLSGVIGMSDLLLDSELAPEQREYARLSRSAAEGLLVVINDILDYAKLEAGKVELDPGNFSLRETVGEACAMLLIGAREKGVELAVEIDPKLPAWLYGDATRLRQVVLNLVSNAVKFTDHGRVGVHVASTPLDDRTQIRLEVSDTGIGIAPDALARLFRAFTQADNTTARRYGGTGLGLTISAQLIEAMGGTIGGSSEPGTGSTFWFEVGLPAAHENSEAQLTVLDHDTPALDERFAPHPVLDDAPIVLLAEDNPTNQIITARMLENIGYQVELVSDGRDALLATEQSDYAAVLMDCQMPEMDGYEATREIRLRDSAGKHLPIIALTASTMAGDREKCLAAGMDDYISKPVSTSTLAETLDRHIPRRLLESPDRR
jgi:signal transduction histidine kinase/CheY-like chemotaxis protein